MTSRSISSLVPTERDLQPSRIIFADVVAGMDPFHPISTNLSYTMDLDYRRYIFHVVVKSLPNDPFVYKVDEEKFYTAGNPLFVFEEIGLAARAYFRNLYQPPEANIILGEE